jgi:hypothetical protein
MVHFGVGEKELMDKKISRMLEKGKEGFSFNDIIRQKIISNQSAEPANFIAKFITVLV